MAKRRTLRMPQSPLATLRGDARADRATHSSAAEAAIAVRIFCQILLVIVFGEIERRGVENFRSDQSHVLGRKRLAVRSLRGLGGGALLRRKGVDAGAVLRANVVALPHALGRIVAFPERLE